MKKNLSIMLCVVLLSLLFISCDTTITNEESVVVPSSSSNPSQEVNLNNTNQEKSENKDSIDSTTQTTQSNEKTDNVVSEKEPDKTVAPQTEPAINVMLPKVTKVGRETCIPCATMTKLFNKMSPGLAGKADFELIDIEKDPSAIERFQLTAIPLIVFYDTQGKEIYRQLGVMEEQQIIDWLTTCGMKK
jgi:thioredoxin-like negative regulator of GroEL